MGNYLLVTCAWFQGLFVKQIFVVDTFTICLFKLYHYWFDLFSLEISIKIHFQKLQTKLNKCSLRSLQLILLHTSFYLCFNRYGLLGASGCGKTTLLSCIVGRRSFDSGQVLVLGGEPGSPDSGIPGPRVGYMPQELALYDEFTIKETLQYFGRIYQLQPDFVDSQLEFLSNLVDLPPSHRFIKTLSGGQQRRVSFVVALFHEPELLILDEPTVGVDPLLRHRYIL